MNWSGWIVTSDWYDEMGTGFFPGQVERTRTQAIHRFMESYPENRLWRSVKNDGWRCVKAIVEW